MEVNIAQQTLLFFWSILLGAGLMLLYDLFRILRIAVYNPAPLVMAEDILFWGVCAVVTVLFMIAENHGEIRYFILLGELLGALLCYYTLSRVLMACSKAIISLIRRIARVIYRLLLRPVYRVIHWVARLFIRIVGFFGALSKKTCHKANYALKRRRVMLYNLVISERDKRRGKKGAKRHEGKEEQGAGAPHA